MEQYLFEYQNGQREEVKGYHILEAVGKLKHGQIFGVVSVREMIETRVPARSDIKRTFRLHISKLKRKRYLLKMDGLYMLLQETRLAPLQSPHVDKWRVVTYFNTFQVPKILQNLN